MKMLCRAITLALGTVGFVASAHSATYVVTANGNSFDNKLARKIEAAGGTITARLPQIGVAVVQSDNADFVTRAGRTPGVRSVVEDVVLQFEVPPNTETIDENYGNPPS